MMFFFSLIASVSLAAESPAFHPTKDGDPAWVTEAGRLRIVGSSGAGVAVRPTGTVLARAADPAGLLEVAGVRRVVPLRGDGRTVRLELEDGFTSAEVARRLFDASHVEWAHPDFILPLVAHEVPDDPYFAAQWHLDNVGSDASAAGVDVRAMDAWRYTDGAGGLIAIVDSGVQTDHPDLSVINGYDYADRDDDSNPTDNAHGTAAAGLAAAIGWNGTGVTGVAHGADVYGIRLLGGATTLEDVRDAFIEATDAGAWVINNSWGFGEGCPDIPRLGAIEDGLEYAEANGRDGLGTVVVFSAGNGGCDMSNNWMLGFDTVVAVGATNRADVLESYSSYGDFIDITGPSGGVLTTDMVGDAGYGAFEGDGDYWAGFSGTSASAPIVSGVFGLMFAANESLSAADARQLVCDTATRIDVGVADYDADGWSSLYGCGRIDAGAAVATVANQLPGEVVVTGPGAEVWADEVWLRWAAAEDPDGDLADYAVRWWVNGDEDEAQTVETSSTELDLTGQVSVGDLISWRIVAVDAWGAGPETAAPDALVLAPQQPPAPESPAAQQEVSAGCSTLQSQLSHWGVFVLMLGVLVRGRSRGDTEVPR